MERPRFIFHALRYLIYTLIFGVILYFVTQCTFGEPEPKPATKPQPLAPATSS